MCTLVSPCEVPANESSVLVGGLDPDTSYSVTVDAINSEDESGPMSAPVIVTGKMKQSPCLHPYEYCIENLCSKYLLGLGRKQ